MDQLSVPLEKTFRVTFKPLEWKPQLVRADRAEDRGEHLVFLTTEGLLAGLFLRELVVSWSEIRRRV
jgi:hypothetical protein